MSLRKYALLIVVASALFSNKALAQSDSRFPLFPTPSAAQHRCPFDIVVWLNMKIDSYRLHGPEPGDKKEDGAYMCQGDADQMNYRLMQPGAPMPPSPPTH